MLNLVSKLFDSNQRDLNRLQKIVDQINSLEGKYKKLTDKQLRAKGDEFRKLYKEGTGLDELLPEVYAAVREAFVRTLKVRLYDVQLMASIVLHQGKIAEQKTGEGKTFSAVPALFLNSISGEGVHLVTVNDYLARRECGWVGPVYHALGATCATIVHEQAFIYDPQYSDTSHADERLWHLKPITRKEAYKADITVGTNNEFGFDYLRDNRVYSIKAMVQRGHNFAIVDEVDSILIDEARTPLIISQPAQEATEKYYEIAKLVDKLSPSTDYTVDEKHHSAQLTEHGILKVEKMLGVDNLYERDFSTVHHIEQALKAKTLFLRDRDYVVRDGEVIIVDEFTGRLMPGRRYSEGLHQAIEAKEGVAIQQESQTLATISFQNYFRMYKKLAGMTGTAATEAEEFHKIYKLDVVVIPTHRPMIRVDHPDLIFKTQKAKFTAVANKVEEIHKTGQPVLIGTTSIEKNELLSSLLKRKGISHAVLNAKNHEKEAEIIAKAGQKGAVTVATNMAGRGVDIKLGEGVDKLGGLFVIGTERHESRRIDNQLRGRSGRQGDPGASQFFVSLEDDIMRIFGGDQVKKVMEFLNMPEDLPIQHAMVSKAIESAQARVEGHNFDIRKATVEYDDVMNQQRQIIYSLRRMVLEAAENIKGDNKNGLKDDILQKIDSQIESLVMMHLTTPEKSEAELDLDQILQDFTAILPLDPSSVKNLSKQMDKAQTSDDIITLLQDIAREAYEFREKQVGEELARQIEVFVYLNTIDTLWVEHLDTMDDLRAGIHLRAFGQREPLVEYKKESFALFEKLMASIDYEIVHRIYKVSVQRPEEVQLPQQPDQAIEVHPSTDQAGLTTAKKIPASARIKEQPLSPVPVQTGVTKVTVERDGQVISTYGADYSSSTNGPAIQGKKPGRNDPCPCGSGKKWKKCHYPNIP